MKIISNFKLERKLLSVQISNSRRGFTILEILISLAIFSVVFLSIISFILWMNYYNSKTKADREALESARRVLNIITNEIRLAKSVYTPTTTSIQLSLETTRYLPQNEINTFIDFFICGTAVCMKRESQDPDVLTASGVEVSSIAFSQIFNGTIPSVKVDLTIRYKNPDNISGNYSSVSLTSTAALRKY